MASEGRLLTCVSCGQLRTGYGALFCLVRANQALVDDTPKRRYGLRFGVKEILKKSHGVERLWVGVRLPLLARFGDLVVRFGRVDNLKEARRIEIWTALIAQNPIIIGVDPNHDIRQTGGEVRISCIFTFEFKNHRDQLC